MADPSATSRRLHTKERPLFPKGILDRECAAILLGALVCLGMGVKAFAQRPPRPPVPLQVSPVVTSDASELVEIHDDRPIPGLAGRFYYFEDASRHLTFAAVRRPDFARNFLLSEKEDLNFGFTDSAIWLRIDVEKVGDRRPDLMLTFDYPLLDRIEIYDEGRPGPRPMVVLGDRRPFDERIVPHRTFAVPLRLDGGQRYRFYVRVVTESSMQIRPGIVSGHDLFLASVREELAFGVVYGIILLMAVYNLFLYFALRDRSYIAYVGSTLCGFGFLMALNGHAFQYVWPRWPGVANVANPLLASLWVVATAGFARLFLEPSRYSRVVSTVLVGLMTAGIVSTSVAMLASYRPAMMLASGIASANAVTLLVCGGIIWWRGHRAARFFTLAWIGLGAGTVILAFSRFGLIPDNGFTRNGALVGAIIDIVLLSLALSDKYRLMTFELEGYSKGLEAKVVERTRQLEEANSTLERLSQTDPLTQVANRRRFDECLEYETKRHRRTGMLLSVVMVDIDYFKQFNDRYGHQGGDECLQRVARAITGEARRPTDLVARYGGEEFAVLFPDTGREGALAIAESIRAAVRALCIPNPLESEGSGIVTVSVGVGTILPEDDDSGSELVALADAALYEAKRKGRDAVVEATIV